MKLKFNSISGLFVLATAVSCATIGTAAAQTVKPSVTGIGYSTSKAGAAARSIRAWTRATINTYGFTFADYNSARSKSLNCAFIGGGGVGTNSVGVDGNINNPWTCTTRARPVGYGPVTYNSYKRGRRR
ncbi:MAG: hypothetical protein ACR2PG_14095 [Hyphomicrobiaceae bacterium]